MSGDPGFNGPPQPPICQSGNDCCAPDELVCTGDPDKGTVCRCFKSWDCESVLNPEKCAQKPGDTPDGKLDWSCKVEGGMEICTRPGHNLPPGKNGWSCYKGTHGNTVCQRPVHTPGGGTGWSCHYEEGVNKICVWQPPTVKQDQTVPGTKLDAGTPPPPPPPPKKDAGTKPTPDKGTPPGQSGWNCHTDGNGVTVCKKGGAGMPKNGNGSWKCYWKGNKIVCEGSSPSPPGGAGWNCVPNPKVGGWRCEKNVGPGDMPPGKGSWGCTSGSAMGGTVCTQNPSPPAGSGQQCVPNTKMWCDGAAYCGWGVVVCGPDGKWKTRVNPKTGKVELDCWEPANGKRPNTACACYFTYYNKACCEQPSCIIPPGTSGQICPPSPGGYCDYCNALNPECKTPGAKCVVTGSHETFCGQDCIGGKPCPPNSMCMKFTLKAGTTWQCVPPDISCYF